MLWDILLYIQDLLIELIWFICKCAFKLYNEEFINMRCRKILNIPLCFWFLVRCYTNIVYSYFKVFYCFSHLKLYQSVSKCILTIIYVMTHWVFKTFQSLSIHLYSLTLILFFSKLVLYWNKIEYIYLCIT